MGSSIVVAKDRAIATGVRLGRTSRKRVYIRKCGIENMIELFMALMAGKHKLLARRVPTRGE